MFALYPTWALLGMMAGGALFVGSLVLGYPYPATPGGQHKPHVNPLPETPVEVLEKPVDHPEEGWQVSAPVPVQDQQQRHATMQVIVLTGGDYHWKFRETDTDKIEGEGGQIIAMAERLQRPGLRAMLRGAEKVIVLGAASREGADTDSVREEQRARQRAENLARDIAENVVTDAEIYCLNLGYYLAVNYAPNHSIPSDDQRRVVLLTINHATPGLDLHDALRTRLEQGVAGFPFRLSDYSTYDLTQRR